MVSHPRDGDEIREFFAEANFDHAVGSVHEIDGMNVQVPANFSGEPTAELDAYVDRYFDTLVELIESALFDVAASLDLIERVSALRGRATETHHRRIGRALADSETIPEINAGRALTDEGVVHPSSGSLDVLHEYDVSFTAGTDSHYPSGVSGRVGFLEEFLSETGIEPIPLTAELWNE